jgi:very-short-patch-repair endonuclease
LKLGIELDGESDHMREAPASDARRAQFIESLGIRLLRIHKDDVYEILDGVWEAIKRAAAGQIEQLGSHLTRGRRMNRSATKLPTNCRRAGGDNE